MSKKTKEKPLEKESTTSQSFSYAKGTVSLQFTLRVDHDKELKDFRQLMAEGIRDIDNVLLHKR